MKILFSNLPHNLNGEFRRRLVENTKDTNRNLQEVINIINNHKKRNEIQHSTSQIEHQAQNLERVINKMESRINGQIYGEEYQGENEVVDARVDIESKNHENLQKRLETDFERLEKVAKLASDISKENEKEIQETAYYENVEKFSGRKFDTSYKILEIPHKDKDGNIIKIKRGIEGSNKSKPEHITAREFSNRHKATVVTNASTGSGSKLMLHGQQIYNGEILQSIKKDQYEPLKDRWTLAIGDNNELEAFNPNVSAQEIKDKGYNNALSGFGPLIENGKPVYSKGDYSVNSEESHPRMVIGKLPNNNILFFSCDGRVSADGLKQKGMTLSEVVDTLLDHYGDIDFAYNLDGGGSTSLVYRSRLLNKTTDNNNKTERNVLDFLYISKEAVQPRDNDLAELNEAVGELRSGWQFLYGLYINLNRINNQELLLGTYNDYTGIVSMDKDEPKKKIYMGPDGFRFWDYEEERTVFRANKDQLQFNNHEIGRYYSSPEGISNANNIKYGGVYSMGSQTKGSPYFGVSSGVLTQHNVTRDVFKEGDDAIVFQWAYPFSRTNNENAKRRVYNKEDGWSDWFNL